MCCFTPSGRKKVHENLNLNMALFAGLRKSLPDGHSMEWADCRLSLLSAQKCKCYISGEELKDAADVICWLKIPKSQGGTEQYRNLVLIHKKYLSLLENSDVQTLKAECRLLKVTPKSLMKVNALRSAANLAAI